MYPARPRIITAGFVCFAVVYVWQANFPGRYLGSYLLLVGLAAGVAFSALRRWGSDERLAIGLLFAIPMADQLIALRFRHGQLVQQLLLYVLVPLGLLWLARREMRPSDVGLSFGSRRTTARITAAFLLVAACLSVVGLGFTSMTRYYPVWRSGTVTIQDFLYNEGVISVLMFASEFFYRGVVLFVLARRSFWGSILLQTLPYAFLHLGKPDIEVPYSFFAGIAFGWANLRSRSVIPSWATHAIGSALFDALILLT